MTTFFIVFMISKLNLSLRDTKNHPLTVKADKISLWIYVSKNFIEVCIL